MIHTFKKLFHIGTLTPAHKGIQGFSHEGAGLSVSECPDAWLQIARLGESPRWELTKPDNRFLNWLAVPGREKRRICEWGLACGLAYEGPVWQVSWFDDEREEDVFFLFDNEQEALAEGDGEGHRIQKKTQWLATPQLTTFAGYSGGLLPPSHVPDMLAVAYAAEQGLDGVFWNETLDVFAHSAPRAVILLEKLASWTVRKV